MKKILLFLLTTCWSFLPIYAETPTEDEEVTELDSTDISELIAYYEEIYSLDSAMNYEKGVITLEEGLAILDLSDDFKFLNPIQSKEIIEDYWGNPPQDVLGMIIPDSVNPFSYYGWAVIIQYEEEGYIADEDAENIDYDELLVEMKSDVKSANLERKSMGLGGYELVGWAESPYYDINSKKLFWAKELAFDESDENTLNYDVRILGRKGFIRLNAVANMSQLEEVKTDMRNLLTKVNFGPGNTYADYNPHTDRVAAYGIGALVAGKMAAKAGFFKAIGLFLVKGWKFILIGVIALGAFLKKIFAGK